MQTREVSESGSARTSSTPQAPVAPTSRGSAAARAQGANKASPSSAAATSPDSVSRTEDSPSLDVRSVFAVNDKSGQKARRSNIGKALRSGEEVSFKSEQGTRHSVEVSKGEPVDGKDVYEVTVDGVSLQVHLPPGEKGRNARLARIVDYISQTPPELRSALDVVAIENGPNPQDEYWAKEYDIPGFKSAATAGGGKITFWNGGEHLQRDIFNHEMGHLIGAGMAQKNGNPPKGPEGQPLNVPKGWKKAVSRDKDAVSEYAGASINEDFAETWRAWMQARRQGPAARKAFREAYPERAALLRKIMKASLA